MYKSPFSEVQAALAADLIARLQKGEPLDKTAAELYAKLAEEECVLVLKAGDAQLYEGLAALLRGALEDGFAKILKIEEERTAQLKLTHAGAQADADADADLGAGWVPDSALGRAAKALQDAHAALRRADTDEAGAAAEAALAQARKDFNHAMAEDLAREAQAKVLGRLESMLIEEIAKQRLHDGPPDRIEKLEQKLRETLEAATERGASSGLGLVPAALVARG